MLSTRAVSPIVATVLLLAVSISLAAAFYTYLASLQSQLQTQSSTWPFSQLQPFHIDTAYVNNGYITLIVRALSDRSPDLNHALIVVKTSTGETVTTIKPSSVSCTGSVCTVTAPAIVSSGQYVITLSTATGGTASQLAQLNVPPPSPITFALSAPTQITTSSLPVDLNITVSSVSVPEYNYSVILDGTTAAFGTTTSTDLNIPISISTCGDHNVCVTLSAFLHSPAQKCTTITIIYNPYSSWEYNRIVSISFSGKSTVIDYDVRIELNSSNFNFTRANPDGNDIRFAEYNAAANAYEPLSYWIQEWNADTNTAIVWVKLPTLQSGETNILLFYGNPAVASESNGDATFILFDDFDGNSLDTDVWAVESNVPVPGSATYSVSNSILSLTISGTGKAGSWVREVVYTREGVLGDLNGVPVQFLFMAYIPSGTANWYGRGLLVPMFDVNAALRHTTTSRYELGQQIHNYSYGEHFTYLDSGGVLHSYALISQTGKYTVLRTDVYKGDVNWIFMSYEDGVYKGSYQVPYYPFGDYNHTVYFYISTDLTTSPVSIYIDWVAVGKSASPPPTVRVW